MPYEPRPPGRKPGGAAEVVPIGMGKHPVDTTSPAPAQSQKQRGLQLLAWRPADKGALIGRADVVLPIGLQISDIAVFSKGGRTWSQMPSEPLRDATGQLLKDENGKTRYRSPLKWATRELQDGFSDKLVALIQAKYGPLT